MNYWQTLGAVGLAPYFAMRCLALFPEADGCLEGAEYCREFGKQSGIAAASLFAVWNAHHLLDKDSVKQASKAAPWISLCALGACMALGYRPRLIGAYAAGVCTTALLQQIQGSPTE